MVKERKEHTLLKTFTKTLDYLTLNLKNHNLLGMSELEKIEDNINFSFKLTRLLTPQIQIK
jgi:hypothetical protein